MCTYVLVSIITAVALERAPSVIAVPGNTFNIKLNFSFSSTTVSLVIGIVTVATVLPAANAAVCVVLS